MPINPGQPLNQTRVAPPPAPEVLIRTLASDVRAVSQGEISPTPEVVLLHNTDTMADASQPRRRSKKILIFAVIIILIGLALVGYFILSSPASSSVVPTVTP